MEKRIKEGRWAVATWFADFAVRRSPTFLPDGKNVREMKLDGQQRNAFEKHNCVSARIRISTTIRLWIFLQHNEVLRATVLFRASVGKMHFSATFLWSGW